MRPKYQYEQTFITDPDDMADVCNAYAENGWEPILIWQTTGRDNVLFRRPVADEAE